MQRLKTIYHNSFIKMASALSCYAAMSLLALNATLASAMLLIACHEFMRLFVKCTDYYANSAQDSYYKNFLSALDQMNADGLRDANAAKTYDLSVQKIFSWRFQLESSLICLFFAAVGSFLGLNLMWMLVPLLFSTVGLNYTDVSKDWQGLDSKSPMRSDSPVRPPRVAANLSYTYGDEYDHDYDTLISKSPGFTNVG